MLRFRPINPTASSAPAKQSVKSTANVGRSAASTAGTTTAAEIAEATEAPANSRGSSAGLGIPLHPLHRRLDGNTVSQNRGPASTANASTSRDEIVTFV